MHTFSNSARLVAERALKIEKDISNIETVQNDSVVQADGCQIEY
jgi:hypothetical protein